MTTTAHPTQTPTGTDLATDGGTTHARLQPGSTRSPPSPPPTASSGSPAPTQEWTRLTDELVDAGTFTRLNERRSPTASTAPPTPTTSPGSRTAPSSARVDEKDAGPTNNWMAPDEMKAIMRDLYRGSHARPHDVRHPVRHGPPRRRAADVRRRDHRLGVRRRLDARHGPLRHQRAAPDRGARRRLRPGPALGRRAARARPAGRPVAVQRHQVHRPVPRGADDLVLRLGLRRQRPAGQEVLLPAHRLAPWPATRAGSPSTCSSSS